MSATATPIAKYSCVERLNRFCIRVEGKGFRMGFTPLLDFRHRIATVVISDYLREYLFSRTLHAPGAVELDPVQTYWIWIQCSMNTRSDGVPGCVICVADARMFSYHMSVRVTRVR